MNDNVMVIFFFYSCDFKKNVRGSTVTPFFF